MRALIKWRYVCIVFAVVIILLEITNYDIRQNGVGIFLSNNALTLVNDSSSSQPPTVTQAPYTKLLDGKWPTLEILLPLNPNEEGIREFGAYFMPSYSLFWPIRQSNTSLLIVTDKEKVDNDSGIIGKIKQEIVQRNKRPRVQLPYRIELNIKPDTLRIVDGHSRQQWLMLWAENYTKAEYVGFLDSDTVFSTRVTIDDIFDPYGRPIVRPLYGKPLPYWDVVPISTFKATGRKSPFFCMTYFPVVVKVAHLAPLREHIRKHMNMTTFDDAFRNISRNPYSQFDLICDYLWYYQRDSYHWAIGQRDPNWKGPIPDGQAENMEEAGITPDLLDNYAPLIAVHWNYPAMAFDMTRIIKTGICYALQIGDKRRPSGDKCSSLVNDRYNNYNPYEWTFEWAILSYDQNKSLTAHRRRLNSVDKTPIEWDADEVNEFFKS